MGFVVGLTGGIGSGKTVVSDHFASLGVPVVDTDVIAREIVEPGQAALAALVEEFGQQILTEDGALDRAAMREIAFSSDRNKSRLDAITHPAIRKKTFADIQTADYPYCIVVIPLLTAESAFTALLDRVVSVTVDRETRIQRVQKRSGLSREEVERIMATQLSDEERLAFSDDVISNDGSISDAHRRVEELHQLYFELSAA